MNFTSPLTRAAAYPAARVNRVELGLILAVAAFALLAALLPAQGLPAGYHDFVDQRAWGVLPRAMDVLSNLPFALMGGWLLWVTGQNRLQRLSILRNKLLNWKQINAAFNAQDGLMAVTGVGLLLTALCSSAYHLHPHDAGLCLDRLGMSVAFAGLLGLAACERISARAGVALCLVVAAAAPATALVAWQGNMTPWAVLQGAGLLVLAALAWRTPRPGALGFSIWVVIALYAVAKVLEMADAAVFAWTQGVISGHSAKHVVAALAIWPVVRAAQVQARGLKRDLDGAMSAACNAFTIR
ncbi:hypothetical protein [Ottowia sp.]|uniref:hypothetical protein n=1 Tax=Ottowia sp. TaxID=1898956 RepID=UPI003A841214